ncbi:hypothetical protein BH09VER1_BH09VER1_10770 [soil metagenome]
MPCRLPNCSKKAYYPASLTHSSTVKSYFQCQRCTNCCKWPGLVKLVEEDITAIAGYLGLSEWDFVQEYTELRPGKDGLALKNRPNHECTFLDGIDCRVQPVKPRQCQGFPNTWNFPGWREVCEAVEILVEDEKA